MRDAKQDPPNIDIVSPDGSVHTCRIAKGVSHPFLTPAGTLRPGHRERGYVPILELYEREGPEGGAAVWANYQAAIASGRRATLDPAWLPPTVRSRRAKATSAIVEWKSPPAPSAA